MTNDPTEAIDLTATQEARDHEAPDAPATHRRGRRRLAVAGAAVVIALGIGSAIGLAGDGERSAAGGTRVSELAPVAPVVTTASPDAGSPAADESGEAPEPAPPTPPATPGHLVVGPTHMVLMTNDFDGSFQITNDGGSDVEWTWSGNPTLAVSSDGGTLAPGESVVVAYTISWQQLSNGGFIYQSYVDTDDQSIKVTITGTRDIVVNPGIELPKPVLKDH